ncbi:MAG: PAS domain S-box protein, partial [Euryarchaeota archaeon]|nr:PAS domain S-box protein [Euryarchaeota archaeon]
MNREPYPLVGAGLGAGRPTAGAIPTVLCIEDDPAQVRLVEVYLEDFRPPGARLVSASRLATGIELAAQADVVLLDLSLPDSSGYQTFARFRSACPYVPVVVLSGHPDPVIATNVGADPRASFLPKSRLGPESLESCVSQLLADRGKGGRTSTSDARFSFLFEETQDLVCELAPDGSFRRVSPASARLLGYPPEEFAGMRWAEFVHEEDMPTLRAALVALQDPGVKRRIRVRVKSGEGAEVPLVLSFSSVPAGGDEVSIVLVARLDESAEGTFFDRSKYQTLVDLAPVPIVLHRDGRILVANRAAATLFGLEDREQLIARGFLAFVHEDDRAEAAERFDRIQREGDVLPAEVFRIRRPDGETLLVEETCGRMGEDRDAIVRSLFRDVTSQRVTEDRLEAQRRWFRALTQNNADILVVLDGEGTIRYVSPSSDASAFSLEERVGESILDDVHPEDIERVRRFLAQVREEPGKPRTVRHRACTVDGKVHWLESVAVDHLDDPDVRGIIVNSRDVTDRERSREALRERTEELESLTYAMTHDLKTPLASMDWLVEELGDDIGGEDKERVLERMKANIGAMHDLVKDLLQFARIGQRIDPDTEVELGAVVTKVLDTVEGTTDEDVVFEWDRATLPQVRADDTYLFQVFMNLFGNAVKYGRGEGEA